MLLVRLLPVAVLSLALATAAAAPAHAEPSRLWAATLEAGNEVVELVARPLRAAWAATAARIIGAEQSFAEHARAFAGTLRSDFARFESLVGRAGFRITAVSVTPGLIPGIELTLTPVGEVGAAEDAALRAEVGALTGVGGAIERAVILALLDIDERVEAVRPAGFRLTEVTLGLVAILPEVELGFTRE
jgi:hypothetical protein